LHFLGLVWLIWSVGEGLLREVREENNRVESGKEWGSQGGEEGAG